MTDMTVEELVDGYRAALQRKKRLKESLFRCIEEDDFWNAEEQFKQLCDLNFQIAKMKVAEVQFKDGFSFE